MRFSARHIGSGTIASGIRKEAGTIARRLAAVASWYRLLVDEEVRTWPPSCTGASQSSRPPSPGPLPWLPNIPETLHAHPVWGAYLTERCQLVADLADQVQDHACNGHAKPAWAALGSQPTALVGEIAVWRAANGINSQDPRPTGGGQLETLPALWKQRLDRDLARATDPPSDAKADERQSAHIAPKALARRPAAPVPKTRTASERAVRARPITYLSRRIAALGTGCCTPRGDGRKCRTGSTQPNLARYWTRELEGFVLPRAAGRGGRPAWSRSRGAQRGVRASETRG